MSFLPESFPFKDSVDVLHLGPSPSEANVIWLLLALPTELQLLSLSYEDIGSPGFETQSYAYSIINGDLAGVSNGVLLSLLGPDSGAGGYRFLALRRNGVDRFVYTDALLGHSRRLSLCILLPTPPPPASLNTRVCVVVRGYVPAVPPIITLCVPCARWRSLCSSLIEAVKPSWPGLL